MNRKRPSIDWFVNARYGMFIHYGLFSILGRGEWVMNRERLSREYMRSLAARFKPNRFDADELCDLAVAGGMQYVNLTTMHHEGFRLYDSELSDFNAKHYCGRDLVAELVEAARKRGLRIALYHSLNNWSAQPDGVDALENKDACHEFIASTHARIRELVTRFNPIDVLWYDGGWPFCGEGWGAKALDTLVRKIQPNILINGRHGGAGDFGTPEGHVTAPTPWRPWEACMTLNNHWGYHRADQSWKSPADVVTLLQKVAANKGSLLLNVGPRGDGSVPKASVRIIKDVGQWLARCGECIYDTDPFTWDLEKRKGHKSEWSPNGPYTAKGRSFYQLVRYWPGSELTVAGLNTQVKEVWLVGGKSSKRCRFMQADGKVIVTNLPKKAPDPLCTVLRFDCRKEPELYLTGGMRVPKVRHAPYDPAPSDIGGAAPGG